LLVTHGNEWIVNVISQSGSSYILDDWNEYRHRYFDFRNLFDGFLAANPIVINILVLLIAFLSCSNYLFYDFVKEYVENIQVGIFTVQSIRNIRPFLRALDVLPVSQLK
jgi:hypothetical protein